MNALSVIIPTLNEASELPETFRHVRSVREVADIIVVDGGSIDGTAAVAEALGGRILTAVPSRGGQLRKGAAQATSDVIVLLHADTWLPEDAGRAIDTCLADSNVVGGGFRKTFREHHFLSLGARWRSALLFRLGGPLLGDQAIFVRRDILERIGGVPDMPLMEEFVLCRKLRAAGRLKLARATVTTSMRRFQKLGIARTYLRMGRIMLKYSLGADPRELVRIYESR
ncbi:MAG: glycosyltransferase [Verrucomicrobia bacterium]|nr:glycosyltransferase [Verrucomicrobiota bacterium]